MCGAQNMLLVAIDYLGMSIAAKAAYVHILEVRSEVQWLPETGDVGIANITLITMSDDPDSLFGSVHPPPPPSAMPPAFATSHSTD